MAMGCGFVLRMYQRKFKIFWYLKQLGDTLTGAKPANPYLVNRSSGRIPRSF